MAVGKVRFDITTGALTFNGRALTNEDQRKFSEVCQNKLKKGERE